MCVPRNVTRCTLLPSRFMVKICGVRWRLDTNASWLLGPHAGLRSMAGWSVRRGVEHRRLETVPGRATGHPQVGLGRAMEEPHVAGRVDDGPVAREGVVPEAKPGRALEGVSIVREARPHAQPQRGRVGEAARQLMLVVVDLGVGVGLGGRGRNRQPHPRAVALHAPAVDEVGLVLAHAAIIRV